MKSLLFLGPPGANDLTIIVGIISLFAAVWLLSIISKWVVEKVWKGKAKMRNTVEALQAVMALALPALESIQEEESAERASPENWSKKEILGHLIDSASNNHQRFVRAQLGAEIKLPGYDQDSWVRTQSYQTEAWSTLVHLWKTYNLHLIHVIGQIPEEKLTSICFIGENPPVTLEFLIIDYLRHLKHHLHQILPRTQGLAD
jgi:hypothetical protein